MISPKEFAAAFKADLKEKIDALPSKPVLVVHQVGSNDASNRYINGKRKDCEEVGIDFTLVKYNDDVIPMDVQETMLGFDFDGYPQILQLPVPFDADCIRIEPKLDVDGFEHDSRFYPATPKGIIMWLDANRIKIEGKNVVVIGRSNIVGKPMAKMFLERNATVTICHSKTASYDLVELCRNADIVVVAVGKAEWFYPSYCKNPDAIIIDVGINFKDGKMVGDVKKDDKVFCKYVTPVPGGVGLLTRIALLDNVYRCHTKDYERNAK